MEPIEDMELGPGMTADEIVREFSASGGFTAPMVSKGVDILERMCSDGSKVFLSFPACIVSTGLRGVLRQLVERNLVHCIVTTCGTLDHDLARIWGPYNKGDFNADDSELLAKGIHRLGNIFVPMEVYGPAIEKHLQPFLQTLYDEGSREIPVYELIWKIGEKLGDETSIVHWASRNRIPVIIPGITDGAVGSHLWSFRQAHPDFQIDLFADEDVLAEIVFKAERTGGLIIGGGISKHHVIWWNQFRDGLDSAVYLTTASEYDGSLSGARMREAVSWGKMKADADSVTIPGEATALLPLMIASLFQRLA